MLLQLANVVTLRWPQELTHLVRHKKDYNYILQHLVNTSIQLCCQVKKTFCFCVFCKSIGNKLNSIEQAEIASDIARNILYFVLQNLLNFGFV